MLSSLVFSVLAVLKERNGFSEVGITGTNTPYRKERSPSSKVRYSRARNGHASTGRLVATAEN